MKTLLLMRHGKASWKDSKKEEDKLRPLNKKGEKDSEKMSELLIEKELFPQVILASTAKRTRETAAVFLGQCCDEITFIALDSLYLAEPPAIIEALRQVQDHAARAMVIGHNPGLESLLQLLTGEVDSIPTSGVAELELPVESWADLSLDTRSEKWKKWKPKDG
jgi:phosphohistidine phosphatase